MRTPLRSAIAPRRPSSVCPAALWPALAAGLEVSLALDNPFDKRCAHPAADVNWQNAFEQDGETVRLKLSYRY